ncbi:unnamed protein product, partial [marine sediment metagenome]
YSFTTTLTGDWTVTVYPGASFDPTFNVYDSLGDPVGGSFTSPIDSVGSGGNETWTGVGLTAGATYYIRVDGESSHTGDFDIRVYGPGPSPGPGDGVVTHRALLVDSWGLSNDDIHGVRDALLGSIDGRWAGNITLIEYLGATVASVQSGISDLVSASDQDDVALIHFTSPGLQIGLDGVPLDEPDADDGEIGMIDGGIRDDLLGSWVSRFAAGPYPMERFVLIVNSNNSGEFIDGRADPAGTVPSHVILAKGEFRP